MAIEESLNYIKSNMLIKGFTEIASSLEADEFEQAQAIHLFISEYIENYTALTVLIKEYPDWTKKIPISILNTDSLGKNRDKIFAAIVVTLVYSSKFDELLNLINNVHSCRIKTVPKKLDLEIIKILTIPYGESIYKYAEVLYKHLFDKEESLYSIWIVNQKSCSEKKISSDINFDGKVKVIFDKTNIEGSAELLECVEKVFFLIKKHYKLRDDLGIIVTIYGMESGAAIEGHSASLAIYMSILKAVSGFYKPDCALISDIDISKGNLKGVDKNGLKIKLEKAIELGYKNIYIAEDNFAAAVNYEEKINIISFKNITEINEILNIRLNRKLKKKDNTVLYFRIAALVIALIPIGYYIYNSYNSISKNDTTEEPPSLYAVNSASPVTESTLTTTPSNTVVTLASVSKDIITKTALSEMFPKTKKNIAQELKVSPKISNEVSLFAETTTTSISAPVKKIEEPITLPKTSLDFSSYKNLKIEYNFLYNSPNLFKIRLTAFSECKIYIIKSEKNEEIIYETALNEESELIVPTDDKWFVKDNSTYYLIIADTRIDLRDKKYSPFSEIISPPSLVLQELINKTTVFTISGTGVFIRKI